MDNEDRYVFTLPTLLNILFRGRWMIAVITAVGLIAGIGYGIVVKPLYRSAVQIRPGIVAYTEQGAPLRGGIREDIVNFFATSLFWHDLRDDPRFADMTGPPEVRADFVPSAIQFMPGGDVITLTNLSTDPGRAGDILEAAIASYNNQGLTDTLSSDIHFTRKGIQVKMRGLTHEMELVTAKEEKVSLEIDQATSELKLIEYERQKLALDLKNLKEENAWRGRAAESTLVEVASTRKRLSSAEKMLAQALTAEEGSAPGAGAAADSEDPMVSVLKQTASREQAGRVGELLLTVNELSSFIYEGGVKADSLQARIAANKQEMSRLKLVGELVLAKKEADVNQKIQDLKISLNKELPHERSMFETDLEQEGVKLVNLSPLEQVGRITVSDKPVRPRKLRAVAILTILAFCGSLALVFVVEYFQVNREVITRRQRTL